MNDGTWGALQNYTNVPPNSWQGVGTHKMAETASVAVQPSCLTSISDDPVLWVLV
jgi:hypothetical protein